MNSSAFVTCPVCTDTFELAGTAGGSLQCPSCGAVIERQRAPEPQAAQKPPAPVETNPNVGSYTYGHGKSDAPVPFSENFLKDYRLISQLGKGGMGSVYLMNQLKLDRLVAVKVVRSKEMSDDQSAALIKEAKLLARLSHPGIVAIYDVGFDGDQAYMVNEFVEGETLADRLGHPPPLSLGQSVKMALAILESLKVAHKKGIVHRDLKPQNIFLAHGGKPKLGDFGLARAQHVPSEMSVGKILGTPQYMSPEQCHGRPATAASDLYSMGVMLFEMVTGRKPFLGPSMDDFLTQHIMETAPRARSIRPELPEALDDLLAMALEKDPARRVRSASEFRRALIEISRGLASSKDGLAVPGSNAAGQEGRNDGVAGGPDAARPAPRAGSGEPVREATPAPRAAAPPPGSPPAASPAQDVAQVDAPTVDPQIMDLAMPREAPPPRKPISRSGQSFEPAAGQLLSERYELVRVLGQGGMGQVWLAIDQAREGAEVALKLLPPDLWRDPESRASVVSEANLSLKLSHPNIVRLINLEPADPPFLVMEYVAGSTLGELLAARTITGGGPLKPEEALPIIEDIAAALDHAHAAGVIHRDIKPSNVILEGRVPHADVGRGRAKLVDFGIAAELSTFQTRRTGQMGVGTLLYMSPEQVACQRLDARADVYSLASTLYQMLTLSPPFTGGDLVSAIKNEPVPEPVGVSPAIAAVVLRALSKSRDLRPASAGQLAAELRAAIEQGQVPRIASRPGASTPPVDARAGLAAAAPVTPVHGTPRPVEPAPVPFPGKRPPNTRSLRLVLLVLVILAQLWVLFHPPPEPARPASPSPSVAPDPFEDAVRTADDRYRRGRWDEALRQYTVAHEARRDAAPVLRKLALCHVKLGRLEEAVKAIERAAELAPTDPAILNTLAVVHVRAGRGDRALSVAQALVLLPGATSDHWDTLGQAQHVAGLDADARQSFQKALTIDPQNVEAEQNLRALVE